MKDDTKYSIQLGIAVGIIGSILYVIGRLISYIIAKMLGVV